MLLLCCRCCGCYLLYRLFVPWLIVERSMHVFDGDTMYVHFRMSCVLCNHYYFDVDAQRKMQRMNRNSHVFIIMSYFPNQIIWLYYYYGWRAVARSLFKQNSPKFISCQLWNETHLIDVSSCFITTIDIYRSLIETFYSRPTDNSLVFIEKWKIISLCWLRFSSVVFGIHP